MAPGQFQQQPQGGQYMQPGYGGPPQQGYGQQQYMQGPPQQQYPQHSGPKV